MSCAHSHHSNLHTVLLLFCSITASINVLCAACERAVCWLSTGERVVLRRM
jgi:hypothetical protein